MVEWLCLLPKDSRGLFNKCSHFRTRDIVVVFTKSIRLVHYASGDIRVHVGTCFTCGEMGHRAAVWPQ